MLVIGPNAPAQSTGPAEVASSAIAAAEELGRKVVMGHYEVAIERMYPQWKDNMAKRKGGLRQLEEELSGIGEAMARNGVSLISFEPIGAAKVYEVSPGDSSEMPEGVTNFTEWLVLIPTLTQFRLTVGDSGKPRIINSYGFQIAMSEKSKQDWTFINGSDVTVSDLRSLFITLPANMELPEVRREEAK